MRREVFLSVDVDRVFGEIRNAGYATALEDFKHDKMFGETPLGNS